MRAEIDLLGDVGEGAFAVEASGGFGSGSVFVGHLFRRFGGSIDDGGCG